MKFRNFIIFIVLLGAYFLLNQINYNREIFDLGTSLDSQIPFIPVFVFFYLLLFILIFIPFTQKNEDELVLNYSIMVVMAFLFFILVPTTLYRPLVQDNSISSSLLNFVQSVDQPYNLFPSLHAALLTLAFTFLLKYKKNIAYKLLPLFILSLVSTLFIKQHYIIDLVSGVLLALLTIYIGKKVQQVI